MMIGQILLGHRARLVLAADRAGRHGNAQLARHGPRANSTAPSRCSGSWCRFPCSSSPPACGISSPSARSGGWPDGRLAAAGSPLSSRTRHRACWCRFTPTRLLTASLFLGRHALSVPRCRHLGHRQSETLDDALPRGSRLRRGDPRSAPCFLAGVLTALLPECCRRLLRSAATRSQYTGAPEVSPPLATGLVGGFFHAFARDPHVTAKADEGIAGTGQHGCSGKGDQQD